MAKPERRSEILRALRLSWPAPMATGGLSLALGLLPLIGSVLVVLLFDTVLPGRNVASLVALAGGGAMLIAAGAGLALLRDRLLAGLGEVLTLRLQPSLDRAVDRSARSLAARGDALQLARDLDALRLAVAGGAAAAWLDALVALPLVLVMAAFHPWLAVLLAIGVGAQAALAIPAFRAPSTGMRDHAAALADRDLAIGFGVRHPEIIGALGMRGRERDARFRLGAALVALDRKLTGAAVARTSLSRALVAGFLLALLAEATLLMMDDRASIGAIAGALALGVRVLSVAACAVSRVPEARRARLAMRRIDTVLDAVPLPAEAPVSLPTPRAQLEVEGLSLVPPRSRRPVLQQAGFSLAAGDVLTVLGPTGAGKSALLRGIAAVWPSAAGVVRLDGGTYSQWAPDALAAHIGYLEPEPTLFEGSVAENVARFDPQADDTSIIAAAKAVGAHEMILRLPDGYASAVGTDGELLSGGQRQQVALARALYGQPFLLVLDEPAQRLDADGQRAFAAAIAAARARGAIVVLAGGTPILVEMATHLMVLRAGRVQLFGTKDAVRRKLMEQRQQRDAAFSSIDAGAMAPSKEMTQ